MEGGEVEAGRKRKMLRCNTERDCKKLQERTGESELVLRSMEALMVQKRDSCDGARGSDGSADGREKGRVGREAPQQRHIG